MRVIKKIITVISTVMFIGILGACSPDKENESSFEPPKDITTENTSLFSENGVNGIMHSKLLDGSIDTTQNAVVLTDEGCEIDGNGVTHCFNNIRLENGEEIRVNTLHVMNKVQCLSPDEEINITPSDNGYVKIMRNL